MNAIPIIDDLITYFQAHKAISIITLLLVPIAGALIYGSLKSFWLRKKNKQHVALIAELVKAFDSEADPITTEFIAKEVGIDREDVANICDEHPDIIDAGKRRRSWRWVHKNNAIIN